MYSHEIVGMSTMIVLRACACCKKEFLFKDRPCYAGTTRGKYCSYACFGIDHRKLPENIDTIITERLGAGERCTAIANDLGCSATLIQKRAKEIGVPTFLGHPGEKNVMFGRTHTPEAIEKIRAANRRQFSDPKAREAHALHTIRQIKAGLTGKAFNKLEQRVAAMFDAAGIVYEQQYQLGRFVFDFHIPATHTLVEAHGTFWHADPRTYFPAALTASQQKNVANDNRKAAYASEHGYTLEVVWEADIF